MGALDLTAHSAKKHLGQNFLVDTRIQQRVIDACALTGEDTVVEIGPGQGVLTRLIAPRVKRLIAVETDGDLIETLRQSLPSHVEIVHADFLTWDIGALPFSVKVIGNIPYYISTPIIERLIARRERIRACFLTVQLEFGQRLIAHSGKSYGSLSCFAQYHADIQMLFKIKNSCFKPMPKVDSCFVALTMPAARKESAPDEAFLFALIQTAFQQRRKTLLNALKGFIPKEKLQASLMTLNIDPLARPENLTLTDYIRLSKTFLNS